MTARILHVSDPHVGGGEDRSAIDALRELGAELQPDLLVATGDLTHRGRREQLQAAATLVRDLGLPFLVVPGNHDIPYTVPARFTKTFVEWERAFGDPEPVFSSDSLFVAGLNSVRPLRQQGGALEEHQLQRVAARLREAPEAAFRVVALHHHLAAPPWPSERKKPVQDRDGVLKALAAAGAELVLSGHVHQSSVAERREFELLEGSSGASLVLASAPGIGRPRPHRRGETRGVNVYDVEPGTLTVATLIWDGQAFAEVAHRVFPRR